MGKVYTITGGTGYIGSQLLKQLSKDSNNFIYAIIREDSKIKVESNNIKYVVYDDTESSLEKAIENSDSIIHLGALYTTGENEESLKSLIDSNILFSTLLLNTASRVNKNAVIAMASTFSSLDGEGSYAPSTLYAATKAAVETIAHYYKDLSTHFLTFPDTYGPEDWRTKIHNIVLRNEDWPFQFRSSSKQLIRMLHVDDVVGHLLASLDNKEKGVHVHDIYSSGSLLTLKELSEVLTDNECLFNEDEEVVNIPTEARNISTPTGYTEKHSSVSFS